MTDLNLAIIGFGRIGAEHANWLSRAEGIRAVAVADPTPARLERAQGLKPFTDIDALLADRSIDAILISTPTAFHFDHASRAILAGKHVMIEKPMALNLDEAQKLVDLAEKHQRVLSVFHNRRWDIDFLTVQHHVRSGIFGQLINIESRLGQFSSCVGPAAPEYRPNWRNEKSFGGGGLYDWGSHFLDQLWRLMLPAKPIRLFAQLRSNVWSKDCDDFARVLLDFNTGAAALLEINTTTNAPLPRWHIDGTNGSATAPPSPTFNTNEWAQLLFSPYPGTPGGGRDEGSPPLDVECSMLNAQCSPSPVGQTFLSASDGHSCPSDSSRVLPPSPQGLTEPQIWTHFARAITEKISPAVPARSVLPTMALLDAARQSSQTGQSIDLTHIDFPLD